jgi:arylsulfatase A-like enzyme
MKTLSLILALSATCLSGLAGTRPPNVIMIAIDDMNDWIGALAGPADTPHIDAFARSGLFFRNADCVAPACNPSRVALMTGLRPETTGQYENAGNFRDKRPGNATLLTLPQRLQRIGYRTVAAGKIFHNPRGTGSQPNPLSDPVSWDEQYAGATGTNGAQAYLDENGWAKWLKGDRRDIKNDYALRSAIWGPIAQKKEDTGDWQTAEFCARYISQTHDQPYFLACGIFRPHAPLLAPQEYFDRYPLDKVQLPDCPADDMLDIPAIAQTNWSTPLVKAMQKEGQWKLGVQAYLACMSFADDCVGRVLQAIEQSPDRDNTIVILWTDHGWQLGHKDRWEKFALWRQATHAPLIIRAPGYAAGSCDQAVSFLDLAPTVLELLAVPMPTELTGQSLLPWLKDPSRSRDTPAVITYLPGNHSVVREPWNYIHYADGSEELYNHATDPHEYHNLIGQPETAVIVRQLKVWIPPTQPADRRIFGGKASND